MAMRRVYDNGVLHSVIPPDDSSVFMDISKPWIPVDSYVLVLSTNGRPHEHARRHHQYRQLYESYHHDEVERDAQEDPPVTATLATGTPRWIQASWRRVAA